MIDISIVTGTYNRLAHLQTMVNSARAAIAPALTHEFVIVDGGSTDGTQAWCQTQPDIVLIEHGALYGALKAFGDGARAAQGAQVVLANDDVAFLPNSLTLAWVHLQRSPHCGAVAFADNRPAPGYGSGSKVQTMEAQLNGQRISVPYAQVGMFRRDLGNAAGWWGDEHPIMRQGHTYGGDNFLSARIWEMGYTVDAVDGAAVHDDVADDLLRMMNHEAEKRKPGMYYTVYPEPPVIPNGTPTPPSTERLRVLLFTLYEPGYGHYKRGLRAALERVGAVWEVDYLNAAYDLPALVRTWQPHVLLMQLHSAEEVTPADLAAARTWCPSMVVVNWNGDVYPDKLTSEPMLDLLRFVDVQLVVNDAVIPTYAEHGIKAEYWQVAYEPIGDELPVVAAHDVVWLANGYTPARKHLGEILRGMQGVNVGLYGTGWRVPNGNTTYNFAAGAALYRKAKIALGDNQYPDQRGFVSNRIFEALANGAFLLHQQVAGLEDLTGLKAGVHYVEWTTPQDLQQEIRWWLNPKHAAERKLIAETGERFVRERHSFDARVHELFERILPEVVGDVQPA
mgnify:CR=1 FL=1